MLSVIQDNFASKRIKKTSWLDEAYPSFSTLGMGVCIKVSTSWLVTKRASLELKIRREQVRDCLPAEFERPGFKFAAITTKQNNKAKINS